MINSFLLLPFYLHFIDEIQLGLWWATGNILAWLTMSDPGIGDVLQQKIAVLFGKKDFNEIAKTIGSGLIAVIFTFIISLIVGFCFYFFLDDILNVNTQNYHELKLAFLISILSTGITLVTFALAGINQGLLNSKDVALSYISSNIIFFVVNIILLKLNMGLLSIAIANLIRAIYLTLYNVITIFKTTKKQEQLISFNSNHFKKFIRVFSYTSISKIITSFANSMDLIALTRFLPPQMITLFEINRRPIKMLQGLVGRYSVALMPGMSNSFGHDKNITRLNITKQFNIYFILALGFTCLSILCYKQLISLWIDETKYAGEYVMLLLVLNFFFGLIGYFMSNMTYALGDIKNNSLINAIKGIIFIIVIPIGAKFNGIVGVLFVSLVFTVFFDFFYFTYRLFKLEYINLGLINIIKWVKYILIAIFILLIAHFIILQLNMRSVFFILFLKASIFVILFALSILLIDENFRCFIFKNSKKI